MKELSKEAEEIIWGRVNKLKEKYSISKSNKPADCLGLSLREIDLRNIMPAKNFLKDKKVNCFYCNKPHGQASLYCSRSCTSKQFWKEVKRKYKEFQPKTGDKRENSLGYINMWDGNKWAIEHRYIFEQYLGRELMENEIIHHRNGDKADNRLKNLQLLTKKLHCPRIETIHSEDICKLLYKVENLEQQLGKELGIK